MKIRGRFAAACLLEGGQAVVALQNKLVPAAGRQRLHHVHGLQAAADVDLPRPQPQHRAGPDCWLV